MGTYYLMNKELPSTLPEFTPEGSYLSLDTINRWPLCGREFCAGALFFCRKISRK